MSVVTEQPDETQYYAVEQLREAQKRLLDLSQALVIWRARVEKYRTTDLAAAKDTFDVLLSVRHELAEVLGEARLLLMEAEEYQTAAIAGKLRDGLLGFDLMSANYRPVYDALHAFAQSLPVEGTTNAAIVGRLMNNIKLLIYVIPYYRLTPDICRVLADNFDDLSVWRFTDAEFKKFKQVAVFGVRKRRDQELQDTLWLERYAENPAAIPSLTELPEDRYALPGEPLEVPLFQGAKFNKKELAQQLRRSGSFTQMMSRRSELDDGAKRPLLPLSIS